MTPVPISWARMMATINDHADLSAPQLTSELTVDSGWLVHEPMGKG